MEGTGALVPHERGLSMAERVRVSVDRLMGPDAALRVQQAVITALLPRHALQPKDVRYLHPGRTVLILLDDAEIRDDAVLMAGALLETWHPALAAAPGAIVSAQGDATLVLDAGRRMQELLARVPVPSGSEDDDALREALVTADDDARMVALVERLDHARHLHLYPREEWEPLYGSILSAYLPVAEWTGGRIGARYRRWAEAFARRLERERGADPSAS